MHIFPRPGRLIGSQCLKPPTSGDFSWVRNSPSRARLLVWPVRRVLGSQALQALCGLHFSCGSCVNPAGPARQPRHCAFIGGLELATLEPVAFCKIR